MPIIQVSSQAGKPSFTGGMKITPISQAIQLHLPGAAFTLVWNRPVAVVVQTEQNQEQVLPVHDPTRLAQIIFAGLALFSFILLRMLKHQ